MKELQDKGLMLLFGFILEAKVGEKFEITDKSLTTISKDGIEKVVPIQTIDKPSGKFFIFNSETFEETAEVMIIRTQDNLFVFSRESVMKTLKLKKDSVKQKDGIWFIKYEELDKSAFFKITKENG